MRSGAEPPARAPRLQRYSELPRRRRRQRERPRAGQNPASVLGAGLFAAVWRGKMRYHIPDLMEARAVFLPGARRHGPYLFLNRSHAIARPGMIRQELIERARLRILLLQRLKEPRHFDGIVARVGHNL